MNEYLRSRNELIEEERSIGHRAIASDKERRADSIIQDLRNREDASIWSNGFDGSVYKNMPFCTESKALMESSELFGLIKQMPKGALLHCHLDAINNPFSLLALAIEHSLSTLTISSSLPLVPANYAASAITFNHLLPTDSVFSTAAEVITASLYSLSYDHNSAVDARRARELFPGGVEKFDKFIVSKLISIPESSTFSPTQVWAHFQSTFNVSAGLFLHAPVFSAYIAQILRLSLADHIPYLEARINFLPKTMIATESGKVCDHREWVSMFAEEVKKLKEERSDFWGAKIIYSTIRVIPAGDANGLGLRWYLRDCMDLKAEFPETICGFDLVGWEDGLNSLHFYLEDLMWFREECKRRHLDIPFLFHAGETNSDGGVADMNLYDAILLGTKRIGHGFSITHHPKLMEIAKKKNIAIECCPISNELLRYTTTIATHPIKILLNNNIPVSVSNDDSQFFLNPGLSYDFYQVFNSIDKMKISDLGLLARKSIGYSMMTATEKTRRQLDFDQSWDLFLDVVISSA